MVYIAIISYIYILSILSTFRYGFYGSGYWLGLSSFPLETKSSKSDCLVANFRRCPRFATGESISLREIANVL